MFVTSASPDGTSCHLVCLNVVKGDVVWDKHYHVTLASDARTRELYTWLGLDDEARAEVELTRVAYRPGDRLVLVSHGITDALDDVASWLATPPVERAVVMIIAAATQHGSDNATVLIAEIG